MQDEALAFAGIAELRGRLDRGDLSAVELTEFYLSRLAQIGSRLNAVAALLAERALDEARRADQARLAGAARGPLHGIPYGTKDLLAARGAPTTWGAPPFRQQVFNFDATVLARLAQAGALLVAKLAMIELAGGGGYRWATASLQGPARNPWDPTRWAGGSSSGSAAAVAAGLVPFALGSETSGSIITPAAFCGVTGLRPTYGLVSRAGAMPLSWTLDKLGPMAPSAEDCALVLEVIAGPDADDPSSAGRTFQFQPLPPERLRELRIGYAPGDFAELAAEEARPAFAATLETVRALGAEMVQIALPHELPYGAVVQVIIGAEAASVFGPFIESDAFELLVDGRQKAGLRAALSISARDYLAAMRVRRKVQEAFRTMFREVDVLLSPARPGPATPIDQPLDTPGTPVQQGEQSGWPNNASLIPAGNLAGLPALCLPCGFTATGLPLGIQLVGRPFEENLLLSLGAWYQRETDWHRRHPTLPRQGPSSEE
jgi:aspartyl-tRNA(Asn)/glutamyl-tRNA(Gln) amidotransferase subunit A